MGPPNAPPYGMPPEVRLRLAEPIVPFLSNLFIALRLLSRKNSNTSPLNLFVPLLVAVRTTPPTAPYSAEDWLRLTLNSRIADCGTSRCCWPELFDMFMPPST